jgi:hypothetical protein
MAAEVETLLEVWESRAGEPPIRRSLALLAALRPPRSEDEWARVAVGERDARLIELHEALFGAALSTTARCPACGERVEPSFRTADLRVDPAPAEDPLRVSWDGYDVRFRVPNSDDLLGVAASPPQRAPLELLRRCTVDARHDGEPLDGSELPKDLVARIARRMAEADPGADLRIALTCPSCDHAWSAVFDIVGHLWSELDDWAQALLSDVHALASAYGWSERDVLAMSPVRRQFYLDLVQR